MTTATRRWLLVGITTAALSACQTPMQTGSQCSVEPGYFDTVQNYTWANETPVNVVDNTGYISPLVTRALAQAASAELARKGFALNENQSSEVNPGDGGMQVDLILRTRRELISYESSGSPCADIDCWERIDPSAGTRMDIRTIGFLAADIYYQGEPIWRGWVETTLYPKDRDRADAVISSAIPKLFETFPP